MLSSGLERSRHASTVTICKLRKKLAVAGADSVIGTVWGRGYMIRDPAAQPAAAAKAQSSLAARTPPLAQAA